MTGTIRWEGGPDQDGNRLGYAHGVETTIMVLAPFDKIADIGRAFQDQYQGSPGPFNQLEVMRSLRAVGFEGTPQKMVFAPAAVIPPPADAASNEPEPGEPIYGKGFVEDGASTDAPSEAAIDDTAPQGVISAPQDLTGAVSVPEQGDEVEGGTEAIVGKEPAMPEEVVAPVAPEVSEIPEAQTEPVAPQVPATEEAPAAEAPAEKPAKAKAGPTIVS